MNELEKHWSLAMLSAERHAAENAKLRAIIADLLESYLATFNGNKDALVHRAEAALYGHNQETK